MCEHATETEMTWIIHYAGEKDAVQDVFGPGENDDIGSASSLPYCRTGE